MTNCDQGWIVNWIDETSLWLCRVVFFFTFVTFWVCVKLYVYVYDVTGLFIMLLTCITVCISVYCTPLKKFNIILLRYLKYAYGCCFLQSRLTCHIQLNSAWAFQLNEFHLSTALRNEKHNCIDLPVVGRVCLGYLDVLVNIELVNFAWRKTTAKHIYSYYYMCMYAAKRFCRGCLVCVTACCRPSPEFILIACVQVYAVLWSICIWYDYRIIHQIFVKLAFYTACYELCFDNEVLSAITLLVDEVL